jgi:hypothetical protein
MVWREGGSLAAFGNKATRQEATICLGKDQPGASVFPFL